MNFSRFFFYFVFIIILVPIFTLIFSMNHVSSENWNHLRQFLFPEIFKDTSILIVGVLTGVSLISIPLAYFFTFYHFPLKKWLHLLLILPLAFPQYVYAAIFLSMFDATGSVTLWLKQIFPQLPSHFHIKNIGGLIFIFSISLYPYLYLGLREAFQSHGQQVFDVGENLNIKRQRILTQILFPIIRPWFFAGLILTLMEIISDFGASSLFNAQTFTTAIYRAWFGLQSLEISVQIAFSLITVILIIFYFYKRNERIKNYYIHSRPNPIKLKKFSVAQLFSFYTLVISFLILNFFIPLFNLFKTCFQIYQIEFRTSFTNYIGPGLNTLFIALISTLFIVICAFILAYFSRFHLRKNEVLILELIKIGYAIPGSILALAIFIPFSKIDHWIFNRNFLSLTLAPLIVGYMIRFLSIALTPLEASLKKISNSQIEILDNLKINYVDRLKLIYLPIVKSNIVSSSLLLILESMKELPITLMTRPVGRDTLAIKIFEYTSEGEWDKASPAALLLVILGFVSVLIINFHFINKKESL